MRLELSRLFLPGFKYPCVDSSYYHTCSSLSSCYIIADSPNVLGFDLGQTDYNQSAAKPARPTSLISVNAVFYKLCRCDYRVFEFNSFSIQMNQ